MRIALAQMKNEGTIQDNLDKSIGGRSWYEFK